ncbi:MAG TPA: hypothetical protein PKO38_07880, partial [Bacillota bacterium]|nr:hypothetical protein [Bacillota bacterium]HPT34444.1 hypothetical protein [Bacillota bacterium]
TKKSGLLFIFFLQQFYTMGSKNFFECEGNNDFYGEYSNSFKKGRKSIPAVLKERPPCYNSRGFFLFPAKEWRRMEGEK